MAELSPLDAIKALAPNLPANITILETNAPEPPSGLVALPGEGKLWVMYHYGGTGFCEVWLWHGNGGETVNIPPDKETVVESFLADLLCYRTGAADQPIILVWAYV